jgi:hypothetical protein
LIAPVEIPSIMEKENANNVIPTQNNLKVTNPCESLIDVISFVQRKSLAGGELIKKVRLSLSNSMKEARLSIVGLATPKQNRILKHTVIVV